MVPELLLQRVADDVKRHCAAKGYVRGPNWNLLTPNDSVAALAMARLLLGEARFDHLIAIAPEGHVYGYFFERLGGTVLSLTVDYPPRHVEVVDDLSIIRDQRVLLIEDDIISGVTLRLVVAELEQYAPRTLGLFLGREKEEQQLENIPVAITEVFLAEDCLKPEEREHYELAFVTFFENTISCA